MRLFWEAHDHLRACNTTPFFNFLLYMYRHVCIHVEVREQLLGTGFVLPSPQACIASALTWGTQCCSMVSFIYLLTCACMHACVYVWQSHYIGQADLEHSDQSASTAFVLGLKTCLTLSNLVQACLSFQMPSFNLYFYFTLTWPEVLFCSRSGASWLLQSGLCEGLLRLQATVWGSISQLSLPPRMLM